MSHDHSHAHHHAPARSGSRRALAGALVLTGVFTVVEAVGGLLSGSLALLADAGHMLTDDMSLGLALLAIWLARRPATPRRSFGLQRAEILAALANGVALVTIAIWILVEAGRRLADPPEVEAGIVLVVAVAGLAVNAGAAATLWRSRTETLNVRAAFLHVVADMLGSLGVIVAAGVVLATGWLYADPLVSALIGLLVLASSWSVIRESIGVLIEAAPAAIDPERLGRAMAGIDGVVEVHDLHVWTISSGFPALAAHVLVGVEEDCHAVRRRLEKLLEHEHQISHTTLQVDHCRPRTLLMPTRPDGSTAAD